MRATAPASHTPPAWRLRVTTALAQRGVSPEDLATIDRALHDTPDAPRLRAMLDGTPPATPAVIAPFDATLRVVDGRVTFELADGTLSDWRYAISPSALRVSPGARVGVGEVLNDGEVPDALWIEVFGDEGAPRLRAKLMALTGLDARLADLVLAPMLDGVAVDPMERTARSRPHEMTRARFERELGARLADELRRDDLHTDPRVADLMALDDLARARRWFAESRWKALEDRLPLLPTGRRVILDYRKIARTDEGGMVHPGPWLDLDAFVVARRRLSVGDAACVLRRPERERGISAQRKFGAREGVWRARALLSPNGQRVTELRVWHRDASPWLRRSMWCFDLEVTTGRVLVCDLTRPAWRDAAALSAQCARQVGGGIGALAARVDREGVEGVVCALSEASGRYGVYVQCADGDHAEALCVRFHDDEVL